MNQLPSEKERKPKLKAHCQPLDPNVAPSTCSPHGCPPWFSGIKPYRHARGPPPLNSHHRAPLCSLPAQDTMGPLVGAATCPSPPPPRGSPRDLKLQPQGQPAGQPPAQRQHRMQSGAEQGVLCELLGNTPGETPLLLGPALMGMAENSSP